MTDRPDDLARRASDARFRRGREALDASLRSLLGAGAPAAVADADEAAALAGEARAAHRAAADRSWALVRHDWPADDREAVSAVVHAVGALVGARPVWLVVPGREPLAVALTADVVLDNPLGFAALADDHELVVLDAALPAGLWLGRHAHPPPAPPRAPPRHTWELEVWGAEPWLSAATRALRGWRSDPPIA